jgi:hypothetical protein
MAALQRQLDAHEALRRSQNLADDEILEPDDPRSIALLASMREVQRALFAFQRAATRDGYGYLPPRKPPLRRPVGRRHGAPRRRRTRPARRAGARPRARPPDDPDPPPPGRLDRGGPPNEEPP